MRTRGSRSLTRPPCPITRLPPSVTELSWAALLPANAEAAGAYRIFAFHFAEGSNASGFVAWLSSLMKAEAETGAMVVCGYDARATDALWRTSLGLFDYWGCPWAKGDAVIALVQRLRDAGIKAISERSPD